MKRSHIVDLERTCLVYYFKIYLATKLKRICAFKRRLRDPPKIMIKSNCFDLFTKVRPHDKPFGQVVQKWSKNGSKMVQKWSKSGLKVIQKWSKTGLLRRPQIVHAFKTFCFWIHATVLRPGTEHHRTPKSVFFEAKTVLLSYQNHRNRR